ncbi:MAG: hypothetical protein ABR564_04530 [Candidatus Dormibacteria bacterium]
MSRKLIGQLFVTGALGATIGLIPITGAAQVDIGCSSFSPATGNICSDTTDHSANATAINALNTNRPVGRVQGNGFVVNGGQSNTAVAAAQTDSQNGSFNTTRGVGHAANGAVSHRVVVGGRTFAAGGVGGGSFVSLGVGGASNTGGAPLAP